jgi:hypothetical protein
MVILNKLLSISLALCLILPEVPVSAQTAASLDQTENSDPDYAADNRASNKFKESLKAQDRQAVASLITYPLHREAPLPPIRNSKEFLTHWDEYFDAISTAQVLAAQAEQFGWRGIGLTGGIVWFANGHITTINLRTSAFTRVDRAARMRDSKRLYLSAQGYDSIAFQCSTKTFTIRTQYHGEDLRYFAWKRGTALYTKPELALTGGAYDSQGSGGNYNLIFKNKGYTYQLEVGHYLCGEDCSDYMTVLNGTKRVSHQVCVSKFR